MIALITLGIALVWIALSILVAFTIGSVLGERDIQMRADSTALYQPPRRLM